MDTGHLRYVVAEHRRLFPDGLFTRLGPRFLTTYTRTYLTSPHATALVAEGADGAPLGYLVGVLDPALHRRHLLRWEGGRLVVRGAAALAVRPGLGVHFVRTRLGRYYRKLESARSTARDKQLVPPVGRVAFLSHVAVSENARSRGVAAALIERFNQFAGLAGCTRVSLVTAAGPDGVGAYYEQRGWQLRGESRTPDGRRLLTYDCAVQLRPLDKG
ncbi:GNAT family N-acetyltransferase [Yinghuangia sp. YIM S10712]|uniref:GNAT family N-acetyltransferase n=1 Tax=Yinghuangia sp. YIM S10712 TaxID=3436930 RepID=UPI003F533FD8